MRVQAGRRLAMGMHACIHMDASWARGAEMQCVRMQAGRRCEERLEVHAKNGTAR